MKTKDIQILNTLELGVMKYTSPAEYAAKVDGKKRAVWLAKVRKCRAAYRSVK